MKIGPITLVICLCLTIPTMLWSGTVSGQILYEDKVYDSGGFTGETRTLPARYVEVKVIVVGVEEEVTTLTDSSGNYSATISDTGAQFVYIEVRTYNDGSYPIKVKNSNDQIYKLKTEPEFGDTGGEISIGMTITGDNAAAFNIFDVAVWCYQFIESLDSPLPSPLPEVNICWETGVDPEEGTAYNPSENVIYLKGGSSDPDEWDDDVILHELGHWMEWNWGKSDTPGGDHTLTGQYDPRLTWSEGLATYWSCAVRQYAGETLYPEPWYYVDNLIYPYYSAFEIETPSYPSLAIMATNELAVAAVLWDITDSNVDGVDNLDMEYSDVWPVIDDDIPTMTQITLEDFFNAWRNRVAPEVILITQTIFNSRKIKYYSDSNEPNNTSGTATTVTGTIYGNTFFDVGDQDWFKFTVTDGDKVTIETVELGDGCDTYLVLYDTDGATSLASNNDRSASDLSSIITYSFDEGGTYYVRATSTGNITEYGYYDLKVSILVNSIGIEPTSFTFQAVEGEGNPLPQTIEIWNAGTKSVLSWKASTAAYWLSLWPTSGDSTGENDKDEVTVSVDISGLALGTYEANITITAPDTIDSPKTIPVKLEYIPPEPEDERCFIATATYREHLGPGIRDLVRFRDKYLSRSTSGTIFLACYENTAPYLANIIRENQGFRSISSLILAGITYVTRYPAIWVYMLMILVVLGIARFARSKAPLE